MMTWPRTGSSRHRTVGLVGLIAVFATAGAACGSSGNSNASAPSTGAGSSSGTAPSTAAAASSGAGEASGSASEAPPPCTAPSSVKFAAFPAGVTLTTDMAIALGAFKDVEKQCNTKIEISNYDSPATMLSGLVSGQLQFAVPTAPNLINIAAQKQQLTNLANLSQGGSGVIVAATGTKVGTGVDAFKGVPDTSTWAATSLKGTSELYIRAIVAASGGNPTSPKLVALGSSGIASVVASNKVDFGYLPAVPAQTLISAGQAKEVINPSGPAAYKLVGFVPGWVLVTTPDVASKYPELCAAITAAELKGLYFLQTNFTKPDVVYNMMPDTFKASTTEAVWTSSYAMNVSTFASTGLADQQDLIDLGTNMAKYQLLKSFDPSTILPSMANSAIQAAAFKQLGIPLPTTKVNQALLDQAPN